MQALGTMAEWSIARACKALKSSVQIRLVPPITIQRIPFRDFFKKILFIFQDNSMQLEKRATLTSTITAFSLACLKFGVGFFSGSIAILSSAIDSLLDMGVSLFNTIAVTNAKKDPDDMFNYGRGKIEALAAFLEGLIITLSAIYIAYESVSKLILQKEVQETNLGIIVMIISVIVTGILVMYLQKVADKTKNIVIQSDVLHYKTDLFSNIAILIGLAVIAFTKWYFIDAVLGIAIAIYIAHSAFDIVRKGILLLLDVSLDEMDVEKILKIIDNHPHVKSFHNFRTRTSGGTKFVEAHIVFGPNISLMEAHKISHELEESIKKIDTESPWSILFHLDPYDDEKQDKNSQKQKVHHEK